MSLLEKSSGPILLRSGRQTQFFPAGIIADVVPESRRGKAMGTVMGAFAAASVLGVPLGIAAADLGTWRTPLFALSIAGAVVTALVIALLPPLITRNDLLTHDLVRVLSDYEGVGAGLFFVHAAHKHMPRKIEVFREYVTRALVEASAAS